MDQETDDLAWQGWYEVDTGKWMTQSKKDIERDGDLRKAYYERMEGLDKEIVADIKNPDVDMVKIIGKKMMAIHYETFKKLEES